MGKKIDWDIKPLVRFGRDPDKFDRAIVGVSDDMNQYVYDINKILNIYQADGMTLAEAEDAFFYEITMQEQDHVRHYYPPIIVRLGADSIQTARQLAEEA